MLFTGTSKGDTINGKGGAMIHLLNSSYKIKMLFVFFVFLLAFVFLHQNKKDTFPKKDATQELIIMEYDPENLSEKVYLYCVENNDLKKNNEINLFDIREWNRNLRYMTGDGKLVYFQTLKEISLDGFQCGKPRGDSKDIQFFSGNDSYYWNAYPVYVEHVLTTGEERKLLFFNFLMTYPPTTSISYRHTVFFQSNIENEILRSYSAGTLTFFSIQSKPMNKNYPDFDFPIYKIFTGLNKCSAYDSFNPLMSDDGRFIAFDVAKIQNITDRETASQIININKTGYFKNKNLYGFDRKKISINKGGWSILLIKRESPEKPELLVSNYRLFEQGKIPSRIPHKCWSPSSDRILFVGALEKPGMGNVYSVNLSTKKIDKILNVNDTSGDFNPDLEWSNYGILITCNDKIFFKSEKKEIEEIKLTSDIKNLKNARISPDGSKIMFFGKKGEDRYLFIKDVKSGKLMKTILGKFKMDNIQGSWVYNDHKSSIKNREEYVKYKKMYNFLIIN